MEFGALIAISSIIKVLSNDQSIKGESSKNTLMPETIVLSRMLLFSHPTLRQQSQRSGNAPKKQCH